MNSISELPDAISGATVVVPSAQRALALRLRLAASAVHSGRKAWRTPAIYGAAAWLERHVLRSSGSELLPEFEEWLVFREAARKAWRADGEPSAALIDALRRSAGLTFEWALPERSLVGTPEAEWLLRTIQACDEACAERRTVPRYRLSQIAGTRAGFDTSGRAAGGAAGSGVLLSRPQTQLVGFSRLTPVQRALISSGLCSEVPSATWRASNSHAAVRRGARLRSMTTVEAQQGDLFAGPRGFTAEEPAGELAMAAAWSRDRLEQNPASRFLVLIPDLRRREAEVWRAFSQAIEPSAWLGGAPSSASVLGLEGGRPLDDFPLVQSRLALLRRPRGVMPARAMLRWLRSVCADPAGDAAFAHLERWLRGALDADATEQVLEGVLRRAPEGLRTAADQILARLALLASTRWESSLPLREWVESFSALWSEVAPPSRSRLTSAEQQVAARLDALLEELARTVSQQRLFDGHAAASLVVTAVARTRFEPASGDAAVTLSAALSDPVVSYDGIWVCGLDAAAWPPAPRLDAFIPAAVQRAAALPQATPSALAREARAAMSAWSGATHELVLSWSRFEDDVERQESDLAARFLGGSGFDPAPPLTSAFLPAQLHRANRLQRFDDERGIALDAGADIPSGSRTLQLQAQCAFSAYAQVRLRALPTNENRAGIDPRDRGRFLHSALEQLWRRLKSGPGLRDARAELATHIEHALDAAETELRWNDRTHASHRHRSRERQRLAALLLASCDFDEQRPGFLDVICEQPQVLTLAGSSVRLRIDRMDRLPNGHVAIFDYKSGQPAPVKLTGDRLVDPQLPLYALAAADAGETVDSVALAFVTRGAVNLRGLAADTTAVRKVKLAPDWAAQLARWRTQLDAIAAEFLSGAALRDPVDGACRYCHLQVFCRISRLPEDPDFLEEESDDSVD